MVLFTMGRLIERVKWAGLLARCTQQMRLVGKCGQAGAGKERMKVSVQ